MTHSSRIILETPQLEAQDFEQQLRPSTATKTGEAQVKIVKELAAVGVESAQSQIDKLDRESQKLRAVVQLCIMKNSEVGAPAFRRRNSYDECTPDEKAALKSGMRCILGGGCSEEHAEETVRKSFSSEKELFEIADKVLGAGVLETNYAERLLNRRDVAAETYVEIVCAAPIIIAEEAEHFISKAAKTVKDFFESAREELIEKIFHADGDLDSKKRGRENLEKKDDEDASKKEERRRRRIKVKVCNQSEHHHMNDEEEEECNLPPQGHNKSSLESIEISVEQLWNEIERAISEDCLEEQVEELQDRAEELNQEEYEEELEEETFEDLLEQYPEFANLAIAIGLSQRDWTEEKTQVFLDSMIAWYLQRRAVLSQAA